jgi:hypothetical protein
MQIHELNNKRKVTTEAISDYLPTAAVNAWDKSKAVLQNPKAFINSAELGAAQQSATQADAARSANRLSNPDAFQKALGDRAYSAGASAKTPATPQQQLAQVQSNPAVQQMVKNLAAQWKTQGAAVAGKLKTPNIAEAVAPIDPRSIKDPEERALLNLFYKQQGMEMPADSVSQPPQVVDKANQKLNAFSAEFQNWAEPKLRAIGVNLNTVMQDQWAAKTIQELLTKLSVESLANPESTATTGLVEQFFNVVIATNQSQQQGSPNARRAQSSAPAASAGTEQTDDSAILKQYGLNMSTSQLDALATALRRADKQGLGSVRNTGNELLNALVRAAGYKVAET